MLPDQLEGSADAIILGSGSFGRIELMRDRKSKIPFAVKKITNQTITEKEQYWPLSNDIATHTILHHQNLIKFYGVFFDNEAICIIEEYAPFGDLQRLLDSVGRVDENRAKSFMRALIRALTFCHDKSIEHREIIPKNLLIGYNGRLKLSIIGTIKRGTKENDKKIGTHGYTPPEVYNRGNIIIHESMDSFSIGIILFMVLIGKHPFLYENPSEAEILSRMRKKEFSIPTDIEINEYANELIHSLLVSNPRDRRHFNSLIQDPWIRESDLV